MTTPQPAGRSMPAVASICGSATKESAASATGGAQKTKRQRNTLTGAAWAADIGMTGLTNAG